MLGDVGRLLRLHWYEFATAVLEFEKSFQRQIAMWQNRFVTAVAEFCVPGTRSSRRERDERTWKADTLLSISVGIRMRTRR
jgi:hypothetical protein